MSLQQHRDKVRRLLEEAAGSGASAAAQLDSIWKAKEICQEIPAVVDKVSSELLKTVERLRDVEATCLGLQWLQELSFQNKSFMVETARLALWLFMDPTSVAGVRKKVLEMFTLFFNYTAEELSIDECYTEENSVTSTIWSSIFSFIKHLCAKLPGSITDYPGACRLRIYKFLACCAIQANEWAKVPTKGNHLLHRKALPQFLQEFATKDRSTCLLDILWHMLKANLSRPTDDMAICCCIWSIAKNCYPNTEANRISDAASYIVAGRLSEMAQSKNLSDLSPSTKPRANQCQRSFFYLHKSHRKEILSFSLLRASSQAAQDSSSSTIKLPPSRNLLRPYVTLPPKGAVEFESLRVPIVPVAPGVLLVPQKRKRRCFDSSDEEDEDMFRNTSSRRSRPNINNRTCHATQDHPYEGENHHHLAFPTMSAAQSYAVARDPVEKFEPVTSFVGSPLKWSFDRMTLNGTRTSMVQYPVLSDAPEDPRLRARLASQRQPPQEPNDKSNESSFSSPAKDNFKPLVANYVQRRRTLLPTPNTPPKEATFSPKKTTPVRHTSPRKPSIAFTPETRRPRVADQPRRPILPPADNERRPMVTSPSSKPASQRPRIEAKRPVHERLGKRLDFDNDDPQSFMPVFAGMEHRLEQFGNRTISHHRNVQKPQYNSGVIRRLDETKKKNVHLRLGVRSKDY